MWPRSRVIHFGIGSFLLCKVRNKTSKCFCSQLLIYNNVYNVPMNKLCLQLQINLSGGKDKTCTPGPWTSLLEQIPGSDPNVLFIFCFFLLKKCPKAC